MLSSTKSTVIFRVSSVMRELQANKLFSFGLVCLVSIAVLLASCSSSEPPPTATSRPLSGQPAPTVTSDSTSVPPSVETAPASPDATPGATPQTGDAPATATAAVTNVEPSDTVGPLEPALILQDPAPANRAEALEALVDFAVRAKSSNLTILELFSGGFAVPLLSDGVNVDSASFQQLLKSWDALMPIRERTLAAIDLLDEQESASSSQRNSSRDLASVLPGAFESVRTSAASFFGWVGGSGERSRTRILAVADTMSEPARTQLFTEWRSSYADQTRGIQDAGTFFTKLREGELDSTASQLHTQLLDVSLTSVDAPQYGQIAQDQNATLTQVAFEEGAEGIVKGAEFEIEASAAALNAQFPGISTGREYADQANEWSEYIKDVYENPVGGAADLLSSQIEGQLVNPFGGTASEVLGSDARAELGDAISGIANAAVGTDSAADQPTTDSGAARLGEDVQAAIAINEDPEDGAATVSIAVPDPEDRTITLPEGEFEVNTYGPDNLQTSTDTIVIETGWERTVGAPGTDFDSIVLRSNTVSEEIESKIETPDTVAKWILINTEVNPDNLETEVNVAATQGRFEGTINDWEISETSFSHRDKFVDNDFFYYDTTMNFDWDAPPGEMEPGEEVVLVAGGELSGSHAAPGFVGNTVEYRTSAGLRYEKDDDGNNRINIGVWADGVREGLEANAFSVTIIAPGRGSAGQTFDISAFLWNRAGAWVRWTFEYKEVEAPVYDPPPVTDSDGREIVSIVGDRDGVDPEDEVREECRKFSSELIRNLCDKAPEVEDAVEQLTRERGAALEGLQPVKNCLDLPTPEEVLGCDIARTISEGDPESCRILFDGEIERLCLVGIASTTGDPSAIEGLGDEALRTYVATTGDISVADRFEEPLLHDQAVTFAVILEVGREFSGDGGARIPPANYCSRLQGGYEGTAGWDQAYAESDGSLDPDDEFTSNRNLCEELVMTSRVIHAADQDGGGEAQQVCDSYGTRINHEYWLEGSEQVQREMARQRCGAIFSDVNLIRASN